MKPPIAIPLLLLTLTAIGAAAPEPEPLIAPEPDPLVRKKQEAPEFEKCTPEEVEAAKSAEYSGQVVLKPMGKIAKLAREGSSRMPTSIQFFVVKDGKYLTHGFIKSDPFDPKRLSPGIPQIADPVLLAIFPPAEGTDEPIVLRYHLRERC